MKVISLLSHWFLYLPKMQMRLALRVLEEHGLFRFFLCGGVFIGGGLAAASPLALIPEGGIGGFVALPIILYVGYIWIQVAIPWFIMWGIILEKLNIGLRYSHKSNSRLERAYNWAND
jgi:hypothetical protein